MAYYSEEQWVNWVDILADDHFVVIDEFLPLNMYRDLIEYFNNLKNKNELKKAGIGALSDFKIKEDVRGDYIYWLDRAKDKNCKQLFNLLDEVHQILNRYCYLSISGYEFHFASYPPGTWYKRHFDQFNERNNRLVSMVIYLNDDWKIEDGGELIIYNEENQISFIPMANRAIMFKSDVVEHEVAKTQKERLSITGWFLHESVKSVIIEQF